MICKIREAGALPLQNSWGGTDCILKKEQNSYPGGMTMDNKNHTTQDLKNSDFLSWRVGKYQRQQREQAVKNAFYTRERDRKSTQH